MDFIARIVVLIAPLLYGVSASERDEAAMAYYKNGDYAQAAALFNDKQWKALALAQSDQLRGAQLILSELNSTDALYNLGLVLANQGLLEQALDAFQRVLEQEPNAEDARHNAMLISELLLTQAQQSHMGAGLNKEANRQKSAEEGEGGSSGASGEEQSSQANQNGSRGASSDITGQNSQRNPNNTDREGSDSDATSSEALEGDIGDFNTTSKRLAQSSDTPSNNDDVKPDNASPKSLQRDLEQQAIEQWFNRIQHDQAKFIRERLEMMSVSRPDVIGEPEVR